MQECMGGTRVCKEHKIYKGHKGTQCGYKGCKRYKRDTMEHKGLQGGARGHGGTSGIFISSGENSGFYMLMILVQQRRV